MKRIDLTRKDDIRLVDDNFKNDNWEQAAAEIQQFFDDGTRTFKEMGERGDFSRTMYQNVFHTHFQALPDEEDDRDEDLDEVAALIKDAYREGFLDGRASVNDE